MTVAVEARGLTRRYGNHTAVDRVDLRVPEGKVFGYLGLNGAGKTTTIKMLTTLAPPTAGSARILGHDVAQEPLEVRRCIGLVGDESADSRPSWSALEYMGYFAALHGARHRVKPLLQAIGLEPLWWKRALGTYSTGMKRRVEIARALLGQPRVLFLDEPTRGLDLPAKRQTWEFLRRLARERKVTIFLSSHDVLEIQALCQDLAVVSKGRIVHSGPVAGLGSDPRIFEDRLIRLLQGRPPVARPAG